jgi:hypothetical protein
MFCILNIYFTTIPAKPLSHHEFKQPFSKPNLSFLIQELPLPAPLILWPTNNISFSQSILFLVCVTLPEKAGSEKV